MIWDWGYAWEVAPALASGLVITLEAAVLGFVVAVLLGLVWAAARRLGGPVVGRVASGIVEFVRSTPLLVQLYFLFYVLPESGIVLSPLTVGVLGLGLHYSAYTAEVYRSGIDGVPKGQWDAARALNFTPGQTFMRVVIPQALPPILPVLGNRAIAILKETPLLAVITVTELLQEAKLAGAESFRYVEPLTMVGVIFLVLSLVASRGLRSLELRTQLSG